MMNILKYVLEHVTRLVAEAFALPEAEVRSGTDDILEGAAAVALEARRAERHGIRLDQAAQDREGFPSLHRFHNYVRDLIWFTLPPPMVSFVRQLPNMPQLPDADNIRVTMAGIAAHEDGSANQALAKFLLFEGTRMVLLVDSSRERTELLRAGLDDESVDAIAIEEVEHLIADAKNSLGKDPVRPLRMLVAIGMARLDAQFELAKGELATLGRDLVEQYARRAAFEEALQDADAMDAVLIRNAAAPRFGEQRLELEQLAADHALLFPEDVTEKKTRNRIDKRLGRKARTLGDAGGVSALAREGMPSPLRRQGPTFAEVLLESEAQS